MILRLLVDPPAPAAWNMAVDEALLTLGIEPTLRLYGWAPHAVSLGYFQRAADFADLPTGTTIVRRLTGGGAIHHGNELTFSLALDAALLPRSVAESYELLHDAVVRTLAELGIASERVATGHGQSPRPTNRWCFASAGRDDLVTPRGKLLGSAQRRVQQPRPRVLHHGSLVLERPSLTPFVAAIADSRPTDTLLAPLRGRLAADLAQALELELSPGQLTAAELALAAQLQVARYENPAFVQLR
jgi:lipoyl(octanoyl) transferase